MITLTTLVVSTISALGLAALLSTDPVVIRKSTVPTLVQFQGYTGDLVGKMLRDRIRIIAREAGTARGDVLSVFAEDESAIETLVERLHLDGVVDAIQEYFDLRAYSIEAYIVSYGDGLKLGLKGETGDGQLFYIQVSGGRDVPALVDAMAERFVERVDPYVLTLYHFRNEYPQGEFPKTLPLIEHSVRVLPTELKVWPLLLWGRTHYRQGRYAAAIERYQEALRIDPNFAIARARWGEALIGAGDPEGGLAQMHEAVAQLHHGDAAAEQRLMMAPPVHTLLGETLARLGRDAEAREAYVHGLELTPDSPHLKAGLAQLYLRHGQVDTAIALLQEALVNHPDKAQCAALLDRALAIKLHPGS